MNTPSTEPPEHGSMDGGDAKTEREKVALKSALADALSAWSRLEDTLAWVFDTALIPTGFQAQGSRAVLYGISLYFVPVAAETRIALVDDALQSRCSAHPCAKVLKPAWVRIHQRISRARKVRNKIAHGSVIEFKPSGSKSVVRLAGTFFQAVTKTPANQLPGMSKHDVEQAARTFDGCALLVKAVEELIRLSNGSQPNVAALHEKCRELAVRLKIEEAQSTDPSSQEPQVPHSPSPP